MKPPIVLAALAASVLAAGQTPKKERWPKLDPRAYAAKAEAYLDGLAKAGWFTGTVLVAVDSKPILRKSYGYADWVARRPLTPETPGLIFSMSKMFTAASVLILQDRGKLKATDKASQYLTDLPKSWQDATIQEFLSHTAGIDGKEAEGWFRANLGRGIDVPASGQPPDAPRGTFAYSNLGYMVLAQLVAKVSGKPFERFVEDEIFAPLGMATAGTGGFQDGQTEVARGHHAVGATLFPSDQRVSIIPGSGGLHMSVDDLLKWTEALKRPGLLSEASRTAMFSAQADARSLGTLASYGDGWVYHPLLRLWEHSGSGGGNTSGLTMIPERGVTIAILKNSDSSSGQYFFSGLSKDEGGWDFPMWPLVDLAFGQKPIPPTPVSAAKMASYEGFYRGRNGEEAKVASRGALLDVKLPGEEWKTLSRKNDREFEGEGLEVSFRPRKEGGYGLRAGRGKAAFEGAKIVGAEAQAEAAVGLYGEGALAVRIEREGNAIWTRQPDPGVDPIGTPFLLAPLGEDRYGALLGSSEIRFARDAQGRVTELKLYDRDIGALALTLRKRPL